MLSWKCGHMLSSLIASHRVGGGGSLLWYFEAKAPLAFIWPLRVLWFSVVHIKWQLFVYLVSRNIYKKAPLFSPWSDLSDSWLKLVYVLVWPGWIMSMKDEKMLCNILLQEKIAAQITGTCLVSGWQSACLHFTGQHLHVTFKKILTK